MMAHPLARGRAHGQWKLTYTTGSMPNYHIQDISGYPEVTLHSGSGVAAVHTPNTPCPPPVNLSLYITRK